MIINQLKKPKNLKKTKRVGRGGKRGTYSGRGQKGQKARAGHRIKPQVRELVIRLPKRRGFGFKSLKPKPLIVDFSDLEKKFDSGQTVNPKSLQEKNLLKLPDRSVKFRIKVLNRGELKKPLYFKGLSVSKSAREKILKAGGKIL